MPIDNSFILVYNIYMEEYFIGLIQNEEWK